MTFDINTGQPISFTYWGTASGSVTLDDETTDAGVVSFSATSTWRANGQTVTTFLNGATATANIDEEAPTSAIRAYDPT